MRSSRSQRVPDTLAGTHAVTGSALVHLQTHRIRKAWCEPVLISPTWEHSGKRVWCVQVRRCVFGLDWLCHGWMASDGLPWGGSAHGTSSGNGCAPWACWASSNVPTTWWWHVAEWATSASTGCCGWGAASTPSGSCRRTAVDRASGQGRQAVLVSWSSFCVGHWHHVNVAVVLVSLNTHTRMHPRWSLAHTPTRISSSKVVVALAAPTAHRKHRKHLLFFKHLRRVVFCSVVVASA